MTMEDMDDQVYEANKNMFETLVLQAIDKAIKGGNWQADINLVLETYNNRADACKRMVQRLRKLEG